MDVLVACPYPQRWALLDTPTPSSHPSNPHDTPQHASRPSRSDPAPANCKRDRSRSVADKALGLDNLRHGLKPPGKRTKIVKPTPSTPTPTSAQSKNPSAVLFLGQRLPTLLEDHLPGRMCSICLALGEPNSSTY